MRVSDKVWVVTGAGSGMGRELVLQLLARGARVAAVDRNPDGLAEVTAVASVGDRLSTHVVDITDRAAVRALPDEVEAAHGVVDGLVNTRASSSRSCRWPTSTTTPSSGCSTST